MQGKSYVALDGPEQENHVIIIFQNKTKGNLLVGKGGGKKAKLLMPLKEEKVSESMRAAYIKELEAKDKSL